MTRSFFVAALLIVTSACPAFAQATPDKIQGKTVGEWIDTLKTNKDVKFRRVALIVLEVYGPGREGVLPAVTAALTSDEDAQVRREAAMLLGRIGEPAKGSVYALGDAVKSDKSELVREAAAQALGGKLNRFAGDQVRTLADALNDSHAGTRAAVAEAILKLGENAAPALPNLMTLAKDSSKDRFSRQYALKCIGRLGTDDRDVAQILIDILRDKSAAIALRQEAADGLGRSTVAAERVVPPMAEMLSDPSVEVNRAVAAALVRQGKDAAIVWPKIEEALKSNDQAVRYQLIRLCGKLHAAKNEAIVALIESAKKDANVENRLAAVQELGDLQAVIADQAVEALTFVSQNDTMANVRGAAEAALKKLQAPPAP